MKQATEEEITRNISMLDRKLQSRFNPSFSTHNTKDFTLSRPNVQDFEQKAGELIKRTEAGTQGNMIMQGPLLILPDQGRQPNEPTLLNGHSLGIRLQDIMQLDGKQRIQQLQQLFNCIRDFKIRSDNELTQLNMAVRNQNQLWMQLGLGSGFSNNLGLQDGPSASNGDIISRFLDINRDSLNTAGRYLQQQLTQADSVAQRIVDYLTQQYEEVQMQKVLRSELEKKVTDLQRDIYNAQIEYEKCMKRAGDLAQLKSGETEDNELNILIKQQKDQESILEEILQSIASLTREIQQQINSD